MVSSFGGIVDKLPPENALMFTWPTTGFHAIAAVPLPITAQNGSRTVAVVAPHPFRAVRADPCGTRTLLMMPDAHCVIMLNLPVLRLGDGYYHRPVGK